MDAITGDELLKRLAERMAEEANNAITRRQRDLKRRVVNSVQAVDPAMQAGKHADGIVADALPKIREAAVDDVVEVMLRQVVASNEAVS